MSEDKKQEAFLDRWSRRKQDHAQQEAQPAPAPAPAETKPAAPLQAVESLQPDSDFRPFMARDVDPGTRREALKRLFTDAQFNVPDPFEPYSIDLTVSESIPDEMLKTLKHAERLLSEEKPQIADSREAAQAQEQARSSPQPQAEETEPKNVAGKQDA